MNLTNRQQSQIFIFGLLEVILISTIYIYLTFDKRYIEAKINITKEIGTFETKENIELYENEKASVILEPLASFHIMHAKFNNFFENIKKFQNDMKKEWIEKKQKDDLKEKEIDQILKVYKEKGIIK
jgi:hypothetical protein